MADIKIYPDFTPSSYNGAYLIACVNASNVPYRVLMSEVLQAAGVSKYPYADGWVLPSAFRINVSGHLCIGKEYLVKPYIYMSQSTEIIQIKAGGLLIQEGSQVQVKGYNTTAGYTFAIYNDAGAPTRRGVADVWAIYPSFADTKDDLSPINDPLEKSTMIRGYNFKQQGVDRAGFIIEDIAANYPRALLKDEKGETTGYDPNCLLALAFESIGKLTARITALEAKIEG